MALEKTSVSQNVLEQIALDCGLKIIGITGVDQMERTALESWQRNGYAGEMRYMTRSPNLLTNPLRIMPSAKSIVLFAVNYQYASPPEFRLGYGRVARYAWGRDYHEVLPKLIKLFVSNLEDFIKQRIEFRVFSDSVPLMERELGRRAGLGFIGKNTLLIRPGTGSFFLIGEALLNLEVELLDKDVVTTRSCGSCTKCQTNCPTGAFPQEYVLDARKCISYLTIEKRGVFSKLEGKTIGEWVFGCDVCQEVCPFNHSSIKKEKKADISDLDYSAGTGPLLDLEHLLSIRNTENFKKIFMNTPILRAKREGMLRNAAYVAANTKATHLIKSLQNASKEDESEVVRSACKESLARLRPLLFSD